MDSIHERCVVAHLFRKWAEQVPDPLLVRNVDVKVADQDHAPERANALLAAAELSGLHVALEDVHAILLVEVDPADLIEADDVVLRDEALLPRSHVDEHPSDGRLATGHEV